MMRAGSAPASPLFFLKTVSSLIRATLSAGVALSALAVYLYYSHSFSVTALYLFSGVFLLSCAASMLNQYQERGIDARMERTKSRALPSKQIEPRHAVFFFAITGLSGFAVLWSGTKPLAAIIGALVLGVYNLIYTPLKTRTPFALLVGAVVGAVPSLIGCAAAIGRIEIHAVYIALFIFCWQVPHFLMLMQRFHDDYFHAGFSTLLSQLTSEQVRIVTLVWLLAAGGVAVLFPLVGIVRNPLLITALLLLTLFTIVGFSRFFFGNQGLLPGQSLYFFQGAVFVIIIMQGVICRYQ